MASHAASRPSARSRASAQAAQTDWPSSSVAFDWTMGGLSVLLVCGVIQDGWAHAHGKVDQSFLTPWHAILYSAMAVNGFVLGGVAIRNRSRGYGVRRALPYGYWLALIGVVLFALGGGFDLLWHTVFGIETDINGLLSPSHLLLAFSAVLVFTGPLRSLASQYDRSTSGWRRLGPAVLSLASILTLIAFFTAYAQPIEDGFTTATIKPDASGPVVAALYATDGTGATQVRLALPAGLDIWGLTAAPDGKHIAYRAQAAQSAASGGEPPSDLYVAEADGSHAVRITHTGRHDTQPAWSPDGKSIAYVSMPAGTSGNFRLRVVRTDGSGGRTVVDGVTTLAAPTWSPDGRQIAYGSRNGLDDMVAAVDVASGRSRWLEFTRGGGWPVWSSAGLVHVMGDGTIAISSPDGAGMRTIVNGGGSQPALSRDGAKIAYLAKGDGGTQVYVAGLDGAHPVNVTRLSGMDAARPAWSAAGRLFFTASGRAPPEHTSTGFSLAEAASLLQAVTLCGILLLIVRRWRAPTGTFTVVLTLFALAMATQTDTYYDAIPAFATGVVVDVLLFVLKDRARSGTGFYALAFVLPALFFTLYLAATIVVGKGTAWTPDMLLGSPLLAGLAGLLIAFCYEPPLPEARAAG
jgi:hypothetical protein